MVYAIMSYEMVIKGLSEDAGEKLENFYQVLIKGGAHDFGVWNNGAYNFLRLCFGKRVMQEKSLWKPYSIGVKILFPAYFIS